MKDVSKTTLLIVIASTLIFSGCSDRAVVEPLTQCFSPLEKSSQTSKSLYKDEARGCYGRRWLIPKEYFSRKYIGYHPITEIFVLSMGIPDLTPGALLPRNRRIPLYTEVEIEAPFFDDFDKRIAHTKRSYEISTGLKNTGVILRGMEVYEASKVRAHESRDIFFFFPGKNAPYFFSCIGAPGSSVVGLVPHAACKVVSHVEEAGVIVYYVQYSDITDLPNINSRVTKLVHSFSVK